MSKNIKFVEDWSVTERVFHKMCEINNIKVKYEPETVEIIPAFNGTTGRSNPTQYTPDFALKNSEGKICIIETKGFARPRDHIIFKLADKYYQKQNRNYYVITTAGTVKNGNRDYYLYHQKGIPKRGVKARTIWKYLGLELKPNSYEDALKIVREEKKNEKNS